MVSVILLIFALILVSLAVFLWVGTLFFQGYIYSEPVSELYWRAPVAGLALTLFLGLWCFFDYRSPGRFQSLFDFTATEVEEFPKIWAVKKGQEIPLEPKTVAQGPLKRTEYFMRGTRWSRSDGDGMTEAIIVEDKDGQKHTFKPELTKEGTFKVDPNDSQARYVEVDGRKRVMLERSIGRIATTRWGKLVANIFLNLLHLGIWFGCLWLLLRYQWSHALGLAVVFWIVITLTILPMLFTRIETASPHKTTPKPTSTTAFLYHGPAVTCSLAITLKTGCA
jgi:hypothetical protein